MSWLRESEKGLPAFVFVSMSERKGNDAFDNQVRLGSQPTAAASLTQRCRGLLTELLRQVAPFGQTVQVTFQHVPAHLIIEGETELGVNLERGTTSASEQKAECLTFQLKT